MVEMTKKEAIFIKLFTIFHITLWIFAPCILILSWYLTGLSVAVMLCITDHRIKWIECSVICLFGFYSVYALLKMTIQELIKGRKCDEEKNN